MKSGEQPPPFNFFCVLWLFLTCCFTGRHFEMPFSFAANALARDHLMPKKQNVPSIDITVNLVYVYKKLQKVAFPARKLYHRHDARTSLLDVSFFSMQLWNQSRSLPELRTSRRVVEL